MDRLDIALDAVSNDLILEHGDLKLVADNDVIAQSTRFALCTFLGEWFLDLREGTDYYGRILGKSNPVVRSAEIRRVLKTVPGYDEIEDYRETESSGRTLNVVLNFRPLQGES